MNYTIETKKMKPEIDNDRLSPDWDDIDRLEEYYENEIKNMTKAYERLAKKLRDLEQAGLKL